jgi:hypothetical protein
MIASRVNGGTLSPNQNGDVPLNPAPGPVSAGALNGAIEMETLKIEIRKDGIVVRVVELEDPREAWARYYNELAAGDGLMAVPA